MVRIAWATKAVEDVFQIQQYFNSVSEKYAHAFVDQLFKKVEILKSYPNLGRVVPELNQGDIRELLFRQYRIVLR
jgi:plasmid stabilization system protein ParE